MTSSALRIKVDNAKLRPSEPLYIACEDFDFTWTKAEVERVIKFWAYGYPVDKIATKLGRPVTDTFVLLYDLAEKGKITSRPGGILGNAVDGFPNRPARGPNGITDDDVRMMAKLKEDGRTFRDIAAEFGVSPDTVYKRIRGFERGKLDA